MFTSKFFMHIMLNIKVKEQNNLYMGNKRKTCDYTRFFKANIYNYSYYCEMFMFIVNIFPVICDYRR